MSIDMDQYPFVVNDTSPAFLSNFLKKKEKMLNGTSQILMQNFLMLGQGNKSKTMTIERITRITRTKANALTKPIYKVQNLTHPDIHSHQMESGSTVYAYEAELHLSYDVASGSEITPCNKINKPLVVYRFTGNVMTSITKLRS